MSTDIEEIAEDIIQNLVRGDHLKRAWCDVDFDSNGEETSVAFFFQSFQVKEAIHADIVEALRRHTLIEIEEIDITDLEVPEEESVS